MSRSQNQSVPRRVWAGYRLWLVRQTTSVCWAAKSQSAKLNSDQQQKGEKVWVAPANLSHPVSFDYFFVLTICSQYVNLIFVGLTDFWSKKAETKRKFPEILCLFLYFHISLTVKVTLNNFFWFCSKVLVNKVTCVSQENTWKHWKDV